MAKQFYTKKMRTQSFSRSYYNKSLITDEVIEAYLLPTTTPHAVDALARMMKEVGPRKYEGISEHIVMPTLIVWGEQDLPIPFRDGERLKQEIKESKLIIIKESGHMVPEEKPEELAKAIKDIVGKIPVL